MSTALQCWPPDRELWVASVTGNFGRSPCQSGMGMGHPCHRGVEAGGRWGWCCVLHSIVLPVRTGWHGDGSEAGHRDRQPGWEREVPDGDGTARAAFSAPALQGTGGSQARTSEAKNG